jgi:hypothetical protein
MGSQLKRIRRNVEGGSPTQVARAIAPHRSIIVRNALWAQSVIAAHETEAARARWERVTLVVLLALFWAGVVVAVARGCG